MSINEIFERGGPVVWVLAVYSVIALAITIERYFHFFRMGKSYSAIEGKLKEVFKEGSAEFQLNGFSGPEAAVVKAMLEGVARGAEDIARIAIRIGSDELHRMERGLKTLSFLGNTAPLLGLFGTITGMIKAFMVIEQAGGKVDAQALAGGIWEAMITTGVGLAVSIPVLFLLHLLEGSVARRENSMKRAASIVIESAPQFSRESSRMQVRELEEVGDGI